MKIDNSHFWEKVALRLDALEHIAKGEVSVLDCFAGEGKIWAEVAKRSDKKIDVLRIEVERGKGAFALRGRCEQYLAAMDLSRFDLIDLDAYGIPYDQLKIIFAREYHGIIAITAILSALNHRYSMLLELGFSKKMINDCSKSKIASIDFCTAIEMFCAKNGAKRLVGFFGIDRAKHQCDKQYFYFEV